MFHQPLPDPKPDTAIAATLTTERRALVKLIRDCGVNPALQGGDHIYPTGVVIRRTDPAT